MKEPWNPTDSNDQAEQARRLPPFTQPTLLFQRSGSTRPALLQTSKLKEQRCALVGNSGALMGARFGTAIDSHDVVVRVNHASVGGSLAEQIGSRTTYRVLNIMWTRRYGQGRLKCVPYQNLCVKGGAFRDNATIISTRSPPAACKMLNNRAEVLCQAVPVMHRARLMFYNYWDRLKCTHLGKLTEKGNRVLSTGFAAWFMFMPLCKEVTLYGFGEPVDGNGAKTGSSGSTYKFFSAGRQTVYPGHSLPIELLLMSAFEAGGRKLRVCRTMVGNATHNRNCGKRPMLA